MKLKSKVLASVLGLTLSFGVFVPSSLAIDNLETNNDRYVIVNQDGMKMIHDKESDVYITSAWTSEGEPLSLEEYEKALETEVVVSKKDSPDFEIKNIIKRNYYNEEKAWEKAGEPRKATPTRKCSTKEAEPCKIVVEDEVSVEESFSGSIDGGDEKQLIRVGASFTWSKSATSKVGTEASIPKGKSGYITFAPMFKHTKGKLVYAYSDYSGYHELKRVDASGKTPKKLKSGLADGVWATVIK